MTFQTVHLAVLTAGDRFGEAEAVVDGPLRLAAGRGGHSG
jgi:hypothetical protein